MKRTACQVSNLRQHVPSTTQPVEIFSNSADYYYGSTVTFTASTNCPAPSYSTSALWEISYGSDPFVTLQNGSSFQVTHTIPHQGRPTRRARVRVTVTCSDGSNLSTEFVFYAREISVDEPSELEKQFPTPQGPLILESTASGSIVPRVAREGSLLTDDDGLQISTTIVVSDLLGRQIFKGKIENYETDDFDVMSFLRERSIPSPCIISKITAFGAVSSKFVVIDGTR